MLPRRRLSLSAHDPDQIQALVNEPIVRREHFVDAKLASELLANAHVQAASILADAHSNRQRLLDQALEEFWEQANGLLQALESERQGLQQAAMVAAEELLTLAMGQLLEGMSLGERTQALINQLASTQVHADPATLSCHPDLLPDVQKWLATSRFATLWHLQSDLSLPLDALRLSNASGAFDVDWAGIERVLVARED